RPDQHPVVIASGDWDTVLDALIDCTVAVPASWGLVIRMEDGSGAAVGGTIYFTASQLKDTQQIADAIANYSGGSGGSSLTVQQDSVDVETEVTTINIIGPGLTATSAGSGIVDIENTGGGGGGGDLTSAVANQVGPVDQTNNINWNIQDLNNLDFQ